ncbi:hypothetical protein TNCV_91131 [Trichonephila clavipes]|nr:hypothetical protein TNCV_91131 [Trichonephila clavipes]
MLLPLVKTGISEKAGSCNFLLLLRFEHDFAISKATDHDVVSDETGNNRTNPQTLVVKNQHINPPEEPELMENADYNALKKPASIKSKPNSAVASTSKDGVITYPACEEEYCEVPTQKNGSSVVNAKSGGMRNVPIMKTVFLFVAIVSCAT